MAAIQNCTSILTDPSGPFNFTPNQVQAAFSQLSLYTNAESCPMVRYSVVLGRLSASPISYMSIMI